MLVIKKDQLACIEGNLSKISVTTILGLIMQGICHEEIFLTIHKKLYGKISLKDPKYTDDMKSLIVDTDVQSITGWKYKKARDLFLKGKIKSVPVVDSDGILMGAYIDGNLTQKLNQRKAILKWIEETQYIEKQTLILLPTNLEKDLIKPFASDLEKHVSLTIQTWQEMIVSGEWAQKYNLILCLNEDIKICAKFLFGKLGIRMSKAWTTCEDFLNAIATTHRRQSFSDSMAGCHLFTFNFNHRDPEITNTDYIKQYRELMVSRVKLCKSKRSLPGNECVIPPELKEGFLQELYSPEYWAEFKSRTYPQYKLNGITWLKDLKSKYINIENGHRVELFYDATRGGGGIRSGFLVDVSL